LVVYDNKGNLLAVGADEKLVGKFLVKQHNFTNHNIVLRNNTQELLRGIPGMLFMTTGGRKTDYDLSSFDRAKLPEYFIQVVTPTNSLYSEINSVLLGEKIKTFH
jgi:hypothetical protein